MGILKRFKDIMSANINAMLDKAEDPEKMIDQYLRDLQEDLRNVKSETATVMADETRCKRALDDWIQRDTQQRLPVYHLIISQRPDSCGATHCITGQSIPLPVMNGGSSESNTSSL